MNLLGVMNQFFSDSLSERTRNRMSAGVQQGRWLWVAPIGYLDSKNGGSPELLVDSAKKTVSTFAGSGQSGWLRSETPSRFLSRSQRHWLPSNSKRRERRLA